MLRFASGMTRHVAAAGCLARGDAAILLRFPKKGYREKIWDHAAGSIIIQEAGAVTTDASGMHCMSDIA